MFRDIVIVLLLLFAGWLGGEKRGALVAMFEEYGIAVGVGIAMLIAINWWMFRLYAAIAESARRLADDRTREIKRLSDINDRLIAENREYHDRFMRMFDKISGGGDDNR